jgi:transcriptional regulator with XRE-family HTH domain
MGTGRTLRLARRRAGLSQRKLAAITGIAQPTIARIECGHEDPRVGTLQRLLKACGEALVAQPSAGVGIDRTEILRILTLSPSDRLAELADESHVFDQLASAERVG